MNKNLSYDVAFTLDHFGCVRKRGGYGVEEETYMVLYLKQDSLISGAKQWGVYTSNTDRAEALRQLESNEFATARQRYNPRGHYTRYGVPYSDDSKFADEESARYCKMHGGDGW